MPPECFISAAHCCYACCCIQTAVLYYIGKGTGKSAPMYRAEARKQMAKCQNAVPAWIMPMNKALETLHPRKNKFDIVIIDEASQSDISSLAILYMGKKLIIVGDDKQVSPMAVGVNVDQVRKLQQMYLGSNIPNAFLFDPKTSIYDVAKTVFQPLMLREHFRCVPEIIGFSNWLSYDFKIKPLRDDSNSVLLPAVVNYRVADGRRIGKSNPKEAQTMQRVMQELTDFEIMPEETQEFAPRTRDTELLQRVKTRAHALMQKREQPDVIDVETIRSALQA